MTGHGRRVSARRVLRGARTARGQRRGDGSGGATNPFFSLIFGCMIVKQQSPALIVRDRQFVPTDERALRKVQPRPLVQRLDEFGIRGLIGWVGYTSMPSSSPMTQLIDAAVTREEHIVREIVHAHVDALARGSRGCPGIQDGLYWVARYPGWRGTRPSFNPLLSSVRPGPVRHDRPRRRWRTGG